MSVQYLSHFDPMVELNFILERRFARTPDIPNSVPRICESLSSKYSIPLEVLTELAAPAQALEADVLSPLENRKELLGPFFQPDSAHDNRLIWAFFHLIHEGEDQDLPSTDTLRHLITLTLNCDPGIPQEVQDFESLLQFLTVYPCSQQTKWVCSQLWRDPQFHLDRYRELLDLCTPVIRRHGAAMQSAFDATAAQVRQDLSTDAPEYLRQIGMEHVEGDPLVVCPSAGFFNGIGLIWDQVRPQSPVYFVSGTCHHQLGQLIRQYSDNSEYLSDRLKSISDKRRLDIIKLLKNGPLCGQDLAERIGLSPATISHHMNSLVTAGFISMDKQGTRVSYSINGKYVDTFLQNLSNTLR